MKNATGAKAKKELATNYTNNTNEADTYKTFELLALKPKLYFLIRVLFV